MMPVGVIAVSVFIRRLLARIEGIPVFSAFRSAPAVKLVRIRRQVKTFLRILYRAVIPEAFLPRDQVVLAAPPDKIAVILQAL